MKLLRFTASWCQPCKTLEANLKRVNTSIPIKVIDIDEHNGIAIAYKIRGVPTLILVDNDIEINRKVGIMTVSQIKEWLGISDDI